MVAVAQQPRPDITPDAPAEPERRPAVRMVDTDVLANPEAPPRRVIPAMRVKSAQQTPTYGTTVTSNYIIGGDTTSATDSYLHVPSTHVIQLTLEGPLATVGRERRFEVDATAETATRNDDGSWTFNNVFVRSTTDSTGGVRFLPSSRTYPITNTYTYGGVDTMGAIRFDPATGAIQNYDDADAWLSPTQPFTIRTGTNLDEWALITPGEPSARDRLQSRIRQQLRPRHNVRGGDRACFANASPAELVALQLLRKMVKPDVFKHYLKYGFVVVRGPSGLEYQVQRKSHIIRVRDRGREIASLCVYVQDPKIPPTDDVVAKLIIIELDEQDIWKRANVGWRIHEERARYEERIAA
jgi:hypothetical protein